MTIATETVPSAACPLCGGPSTGVAVRNDATRRVVKYRYVCSSFQCSHAWNDQVGDGPPPLKELVLQVLREADGWLTKQEVWERCHALGAQSSSPNPSDVAYAALYQLAQPRSLGQRGSGTRRTEDALTVKRGSHWALIARVPDLPDDEVATPAAAEIGEAERRALIEAEADLDDQVAVRLETPPEVAAPTVAVPEPELAPGLPETVPTRWWAAEVPVTGPVEADAPAAAGKPIPGEGGGEERPAKGEQFEVVARSERGVPLRSNGSVILTFLGNPLELSQEDWEFVGALRAGLDNYEAASG